QAINRCQPAPGQSKCDLEGDRLVTTVSEKKIMTHLSTRAARWAAALSVGALAVACACSASAQCSTCATPTVAYYQPAVVAPTYTTAYFRPTLFDRLRMRRWSVPTAAATTAYTTAYAPYTAAYAPYATYAPAYSSYTASYAPYVTAYAPL